VKTRLRNVNFSFVYCTYPSYACKLATYICGLKISISRMLDNAPHNHQQIHYLIWLSIKEDDVIKQRMILIFSNALTIS